MMVHTYNNNKIWLKEGVCADGVMDTDLKMKFGSRVQIPVKFVTCTFSQIILGMYESISLLLDYGLNRRVDWVLRLWLPNSLREWKISKLYIGSSKLFSQWKDSSQCHYYPDYDQSDRWWMEKILFPYKNIVMCDPSEPAHTKGNTSGSLQFAWHGASLLWRLELVGLVKLFLDSPFSL